MFEIIKEYYELGLYSADDLNIFVLAKIITDEQKQTIIGSQSTATATASETPASN